jgi:DNA-binding IscR family transcriptional regulator
MLRVLRKIEDAKLVSPLGGEWIGFVPACDPDRISVDEVVTQMEGVLRRLPETGPADREREVIGELFARLNSCTVQALDRMSIGRLVRDLYMPRVVREDDQATHES